MKCPNCGAVYDDHCRFCGACGASLTPEKKGSHRVPILVMAVLSVLGICLFFATGGKLVPDPNPILSPDQPFYMDNGALSVNYMLPWEETELTIPETVNGETVTAIADASYFGFTGIYLPDTVTEIGDSAFECNGLLRGMDLPPAVTTIGDCAFFDCVSLEAIHIPASVEYIGEDAFLYCDSLAFIFYDGTIEQWQAIFDQELSPETAVCCSDGTFFQDE